MSGASAKKVGRDLAAWARKSAKVGRDLAAWARKENRRQARERVSALTAALKVARGERKERIAAARQSCRDSRARLRVEIAQRRADLRAAIAADRIAGRSRCATSRDATRATTLARVESVAQSLAGARVSRALLARASGATKAAARGLLSAAESRAESDDAVRANIGRDLVPVFDAVRKEMRATARTSRTEVFLDWAQENPSRVYEIQHARHAAELRHLEAEERAARRGGGARPPSRVTDEWGAPA